MSRCPHCGEEMGDGDDSISGVFRFIVRDRDGNLVEVFEE